MRTLILFIVFGFCISALRANAAISFGTATQIGCGNGVATCSTLSKAHTVAAAAGFVVVDVFVNSGTNLTAVSYGGQSILSNLIARVSNGAPTLYSFYVINPPTGSQSVSITSSAAGDTLGLQVTDYLGVSQATSTVIEGVVTSTATTVTAISQNVTTTVSNDWLHMQNLNFNAAAETAGTNTSLRINGTGGANGMNNVTDSNAAQATPGGQQNVSWAGGANALWIAFAMEPVATPVIAGKMTTLWISEN